MATKRTTKRTTKKRATSRDKKSTRVRGEESLPNLSKVPVALHKHHTPKCSSGKHDNGCGSKGAELTCNVVKVPLLGKFCVCTHVKA